jgi:4'-phosphopantetheinyl transferase
MRSPWDVRSGRERGQPDIRFRSREELLPFLAEYRASLSREEQTRAARYLSPDRALQFILGRGLLREILGQHTGLSPRALRLGELESGKPVLKGGGLHFNLSHSGGMYLAAVSDTGPLGVDLQRTYPIANPGRLAGKYFSEDENQRLAGLPDDRLREEFFKCWVRKEAYLKGLGTGFSRRPEEISILPADIQGRFRVEDPLRSASSPEWTVISLPAPAGFWAAAALPARSNQRHSPAGAAIPEAADSHHTLIGRP